MSIGEVTTVVPGSRSRSSQVAVFTRIPERLSLAFLLFHEVCRKFKTLSFEWMLDLLKLELELLRMLESSVLCESRAVFLAASTWVSKVSGEIREGDPLSMFMCSRPSAVFLMSFLASLVFPSHIALAVLLKFVRCDCLLPAW